MDRFPALRLILKLGRIGAAVMAFAITFLAIWLLWPSLGWWTLLLAPFKVFVEIFLADSLYPGLLGWASLGLAINIGLLAVIILLDRHSCEASIAASLKLHKRWVRARRSAL